MEDQDGQRYCGVAGQKLSAETISTLRYIALIAYMWLCNTFTNFEQYGTLEYSNFIPESLGITTGQWGNITGVPVYAVFLIISLFFGGEVADHYHRPRLLGFLMIIMGGLTMIHAACQSYSSFLAIRIVSNIFYPLAFPTIAGILLSRAPHGWGATAVGIALAGLSTGDGIALAFTSIFQSNWPSAYLLGGAIQVLICGPCFLIPEVPREHTSMEARLQDTLREILHSYRQMLRVFPRIPTLLLIAVNIILGSIGATTGSIFQLWLAEDRGIPPEIASRNMSIITLTSAVAGYFCAGILGDLLLSRFGISLFITTGIILAADAIFCLCGLFVAAGDDGLVWVFASIRVFFLLTSTTTTYTGLSVELVPKAFESTSIAIMYGIGFFTNAVANNVALDIISSEEENPLSPNDRDHEFGHISHVMFWLCIIQLVSVPFTIVAGFLAPRDKVKLQRLLDEGESLLPKRAPPPAADEALVAAAKAPPLAAATPPHAGANAPPMVVTQAAPVAMMAVGPPAAESDEVPTFRRLSEEEPVAP